MEIVALTLRSNAPIPNPNNNMSTFNGFYVNYMIFLIHKVGLADLVTACLNTNITKNINIRCTTM